MIVCTHRAKVEYIDGTTEIIKCDNRVEITMVDDRPIYHRFCPDHEHFFFGPRLLSSKKLTKTEIIARAIKAFGEWSEAPDDDTITPRGFNISAVGQVSSMYQIDDPFGNTVYITILPNVEDEFLRLEVSVG